MAKIIPFFFEQIPVRTIARKDGVWFVANDVCKILDIKNPRSSVACLDPDEKSIYKINKTDMSVINESGLYTLILRSRKPQAKRFRKWVTSEVLPSIRKTGGYSTSRRLPNVMSEQQAMDFKTSIDTVASIFHPFSEQFISLMGAIRILRGKNAQTGLPEKLYTAVLAD